jgi:hypothetical protein
MVNYFRKVAEEAPARVKFEQYGVSFEGRPLLLIYIGSPENIQRLEAIRQHNLGMAGITPRKNGPDKPVAALPDGQAPVIVWLSYNTHGNEPSSSEAAMKTLYGLLTDSQCSEWLKTTLVIMDPCVNPDGRERYVNWYVTTAGKDPDPDPQSREHNEPWPGGRGNHYNFDLNRDWVWQTQRETQQRMKKYNDWLPQVHVDFHEQDYDGPYYFAPAAEPYHEVITPWQKEFQTLIGRNNAKYFDLHGWLYFTKETYDMLYPGYGDTYPTYNGAIGMTYEQGGGSRGGLSVINHEGDTLTLADRIGHHFATGMSTIETCSQNASRVIAAFKKYFSDARTASGNGFRSYFIRADPYGDRMESLKKLLDRNLIVWVDVNTGSFSGLNYRTDRMETFKASRGDITINMNQPKSNLIKVLFERNSRISDSVTYDITAWSLPFVYGLQAYGLNSFVNPANTGVIAEPPVAMPSPGYAYAVRWTGVRSARFLVEMLKRGIRVRYAENDFRSGEQEYGRGTLILGHTGNQLSGQDFEKIIAAAAEKTGVRVTSMNSGFVDKGFDFGSGHVHAIRRPRVAMLTGEGVDSCSAGEIWYFFEQELDYPVTLMNAREAAGTNWKNYDVLILPDGQYSFLADKRETEELRTWILDGGRLIVCKNAISQIAGSGWSAIRAENDGDDSKNEKERKDNDGDLHLFGNRDRDLLANNVPGSIYQVALDNSHPLAFGYPDNYYSLKQDDHLFGFIREGGWNVGVIKKGSYISGFIGSRAKAKLTDGLVFGVQDMGNGRIVYLADDPLFRGFWENGKLLFCNAVFLVGQ